MDDDNLRLRLSEVSADTARRLFWTAVLASHSVASAATILAMLSALPTDKGWSPLQMFARFPGSVHALALQPGSALGGLAILGTLLIAAVLEPNLKSGEKIDPRDDIAVAARSKMVISTLTVTGVASGWICITSLIALASAAGTTSESGFGDRILAVLLGAAMMWLSATRQPSASEQMLALREGQAVLRKRLRQAAVSLRAGRISAGPVTGRALIELVIIAIAPSVPLFIHAPLDPWWITEAVASTWCLGAVACGLALLRLTRDERVLPVPCGFAFSAATYLLAALLAFFVAFRTGGVSGVVYGVAMTVSTLIVSLGFSRRLGRPVLFVRSVSALVARWECSRQELRFRATRKALAALSSRKWELVEPREKRGVVETA